MGWGEKTWQRNMLSYEHAEGPAVCMLMYVERESFKEGRTYACRNDPRTYRK